jgi:hypothetical protein
MKKEIVYRNVQNYYDVEISGRFSPKNVLPSGSYYHMSATLNSNNKNQKIKDWEKDRVSEYGDGYNLYNTRFIVFKIRYFEHPRVLKFRDYMRKLGCVLYFDKERTCCDIWCKLEKNIFVTTHKFFNVSLYGNAKYQVIDLNDKLYPPYFNPINIEDSLPELNEKQITIIVETLKTIKSSQQK